MNKHQAVSRTWSPWNICKMFRMRYWIVLFINKCYILILVSCSFSLLVVLWFDLILFNYVTLFINLHLSEIWTIAIKRFKTRCNKLEQKLVLGVPTEKEMKGILFCKEEHVRLNPVRLSSSENFVEHKLLNKEMYYVAKFKLFAHCLALKCLVLLPNQYEFGINYANPVSLHSLNIREEYRIWCINFLFFTNKLIFQPVYFNIENISI